MGNLLLPKAARWEIGAQHRDEERSDDDEKEHPSGEEDGHVHLVEEGILECQSERHNDTWTQATQFHGELILNFVSI